MLLKGFSAIKIHRLNGVLLFCQECPGLGRLKWKGRFDVISNEHKTLFGFFFLFVKISNNSFLPYKALKKVPYFLITLFLTTMKYYLLRKSQSAFPFFFLSIVAMTTIEFL